MWHETDIVCPTVVRLTDWVGGKHLSSYSSFKANSVEWQINRKKTLDFLSVGSWNCYFMVLFECHHVHQMQLEKHGRNTRQSRIKRQKCATKSEHE